MFRLNQRFSTAARLFLLLMMISGCQTAEDFTPPQLHLVNIEVEEIKLLEQKFILHLQVDNPNNLPFALHRLSYQATVNWIKGLVLPRTIHSVLQCRSTPISGSI